MNKQQLTLPCDCASSCTVALVTDFDFFDEPREIYIEMYTHVNEQKRFKDRVKTAFKVLLGKSPWMQGVILYEPQVLKLSEFLNDKLNGKL